MEIPNQSASSTDVHDSSDSESENEFSNEPEYAILKQYMLSKTQEDKKKIITDVSRDLIIMIRENILIHFLDTHDKTQKKILKDDLRLLNEELYKKNIISN